MRQIVPEFFLNFVVKIITDTALWLIIKGGNDMELERSLKEKIALTADSILPGLPKMTLIFYILSILSGILLSIYPVWKI